MTPAPIAPEGSSITVDSDGSITLRSRHGELRLSDEGLEMRVPDGSRLCIAHGHASVVPPPDPTKP